MNSPNLSVELLTGASKSACESFSKFAITESSAPPADESEYGYVCSVAGVQSVTYSLASPTDGPHTISAVTATDEAGNVGTPSAPVTFTVDTTPPTGTVVEQHGGGNGNPTFDITPSEGSATIACSLDGAPAAPCSSPYTPSGTLSVEGGVFATMLAATIVVVGALTFFPAATLGPIAEHFTSMN